MATATEQAQRCPRRDETGQQGGEGLLDTWRPPRGAGMGSAGRTCSYCGSMEPGEFLAAAAAGVELGPTDKIYKIYIGGHAGKFYTAHLSPDQSNELADLLDAGKLNIGYPGYFYRPLGLPGVTLPRPTREKGS